MTSRTIPTLRAAPAHPFYFNTSAHLLRITRQKATCLAEFLNALRECPEDSVFQHTFRTLQDHHFLRDGFSNDFAQWALSDCNEPELAERFANVDVREFTSVKELRERLIGIVEGFLTRHADSAQRPASNTFYFCASDVVVLRTTFLAETMQAFAEGVRQVSVHSIQHHFIEARLRLKLMSNDFSQWLHEDAGLSEAARAVNRIDIYTATLEGVRKQIVRILERALV